MTFKIIAASEEGGRQWYQMDTREPSTDFVVFVLKSFKNYSKILAFYEAVW
jgi:hypothetical protein